jgi:hypothetical protein
MTNQKVRDIRRRIRWNYYRVKLALSGKKLPMRNPREQDADAKEALKRGFMLITVKPGHHGEFLGSRIIPLGILADRDILIELGYRETQTDLLKSKKLQPQINAVLEKAFNSYVDEIKLWLANGYTISEVAGLVARIYREQYGGGSKIERDRKQRRVRIKAIMNRLNSDPAYPTDLREIAALSLSLIEKIK